ncbi:amidase [Bordetella pertussis]|nr:amidase [Bordetella pertussis]
MNYHPSTHTPLTFHDRTQAFLDGGDSPRDYLERCLDTIARREPVVQGWVVLNEAGAREAADASAPCCGRPALTPTGCSSPLTAA